MVTSPATFCSSLLCSLAAARPLELGSCCFFFCCFFENGKSSYTNILADHELKAMQKGRTTICRYRAPHSYPAKTNLQDHARLCKNLARILQARLARDMSLFLHNSCTSLHISCKKWCKILQELLQESFLAHFLQDLARIGARLCKKRDILRASLACKILARFLHDLASSFLLGRMTTVQKRVSKYRVC